MNKSVTQCLSLILVTLSCVTRAFTGAELSTTEAIAGSTTHDWGLKIVIFDVGQADALLLMAPNGETALIDSGRSKSSGGLIADYLLDENENGIGALSHLNFVYSTHYDSDHISGLPEIVAQGITIGTAYDQGKSKKRILVTDHGNQTVYAKYVNAVGDPNNNLRQDSSETAFVRKLINHGDTETIGANGQIIIQCVSVRGDTLGTGHDLSLDPALANIDENPGSISLYIRYGEFELYTAGDQTDNDWKRKKAVEESIVAAAAIPDGHDIDVLKVSHHGSDTSTSTGFIEALLPEVSVISTKYSSNHGLPKRIVIKQLVDNNSYVLVTGDGLGPDGLFKDSNGSADDDNYEVPDGAVHNAQGTVTILVSKDGERYTVFGNSFLKTFSAKDN